MNSKIRLRHVEFVPKVLDAGILYVSKRFRVAAHLCPCGCGSKIITPLGACEWSLTVKKGRPTLYPSIGNWQIPCKSHYWIANGEIEWSYQWTDEEIEVGRKKEQARRKLYYQKRSQPRKRWWQWILKRICPSKRDLRYED